MAAVGLVVLMIAVFGVFVAHGGDLTPVIKAAPWGLDIPVPFNLALEQASVPQKPGIKAAIRRALHLEPAALAAE